MIDGVHEAWCYCCTYSGHLRYMCKVASSGHSCQKSRFPHDICTTEGPVLTSQQSGGTLLWDTLVVWDTCGALRQACKTSGSRKKKRKKTKKKMLLRAGALHIEVHRSAPGPRPGLRCRTHSGMSSERESKFDGHQRRAEPKQMIMVTPRMSTMGTNGIKVGVALAVTQQGPEGSVPIFHRCGWLQGTCVSATEHFPAIPIVSAVFGASVNL